MAAAPGLLAWVTPGQPVPLPQGQQLAHAVSLGLTPTWHQRGAYASCLPSSWHVQGVRVRGWTPTVSSQVSVDTRSPAPLGAVPEAEPSCWAPRDKQLGVCGEGQAPSCAGLGGGSCLSSSAEGGSIPWHSCMACWDPQCRGGGRGLGAGHPVAPAGSRGSQAHVGAQGRKRAAPQGVQAAVIRAHGSGWGSPMLEERPAWAKGGKHTR